MTSKAHDALAAERAAAEAEGIFQPTPEQLARLRRYRDLKARAGAIKVEMDAIEKVTFTEMDEVGALALSVNGKNWALISDTHKTIVDQDAFVEAYPELAAEYAAKLMEFTTRVKVERGRKAVKPQ